MVGLITKLIGCPIIIIISNYLFGLNYTVAQAIGVGLVIAVVAHIMELLVLKKGTFWISTIADLVISYAVVYLSNYFFNNVTITYWGALFTAVLVTVVEFFLHGYLLRTDKTKKTEE